MRGEGVCGVWVLDLFCLCMGGCVLGRVVCEGLGCVLLCEGRVCVCVRGEGVSWGEWCVRG